MHFEKKVDGRFLNNPRNIDRLIILLILVIVADLFYVFPPTENFFLFIPPDFWQMKFIDIINAVAQIATAGAFFFAIYQHGKNRESERQSILVEECKALIEEMNIVAKVFAGLHFHGIDQTCAFIWKMESLGSNFDEIFRSLREDTHKTVVRMRWQEMYFSELPHAMKSFNVLELMQTISKRPMFHEHFRIRRLRIAAALGLAEDDLFAEYKVLKQVLNESDIKDEIINSNKIDHSWLLFEMRFFDNEALNDHLYGYMNIIDRHVRAPALAALNEICNPKFREVFRRNKDAPQSPNSFVEVG